MAIKLELAPGNEIWQIHTKKASMFRGSLLSLQCWCITDAALRSSRQLDLYRASESMGLYLMLFFFAFSFAKR